MTSTARERRQKSSFGVNRKQRVACTSKSQKREELSKGKWSTLSNADERLDEKRSEDLVQGGDYY